ncbi:MAG: RnfABCDGE type electron transport complex subunit B, partial [Gammaproteobacteria bacterium]|nr:RnfABCDGE type electron transport complex subunit B [Gammaproteobacteria bacterium]
MAARLDSCAGGAGERAARIDALLPQTQCRRCGYPSCAAYAHALAAGETELNRCAPGGATIIAALAALLGREPLALDAACGEARPWLLPRIDESRCIGCTLCIQACPVDAILGAAKRMHTVIESRCTGCELCVPPCPVDCIVLEPMASPATGLAAGDAAQPEPEFLQWWMRTRAAQARADYRARH